MSVSLEIYHDYLNYLLIYGYARIVMEKTMNRDICSVCAAYIRHPDNILDYQMNKIMYLLLQFGLASTDKPLNAIFYPYGKASYANVQWARFYYADLETNICLAQFPKVQQIKSLKDSKLLNSLLVCLNWIWWLQGYDCNDLCDKFLAIAINFSKHGIELKYEYMSQLIAMYEYYYFDFYVLKFIKHKLSAIDSKRLMTATQKSIMKHLKNMNYSMDIDIDMDEWSNYNSMKMSSLLQVITIQYSNDMANVMNELNNITDIIQVKYKIMQSQLAAKFEKIGLKAGKLMLDVALLSVFVPVAMAWITGVSSYRFGSRVVSDFPNLLPV